jgi:PhnB protein
MSTNTQSTASAPLGKPASKPVPDGMHTVTPHLVCDGAAAAIQFYKKAFGATELMRVPGPGGKLIHGAVKIGDSTVMLVDAFPEWGSHDPKALKGSPVTIHLAVPNVDEVFARAVAAGCTVVMPLDDMFWGDRYGSVVDPFGHNWSMATQIRELTPEEIMKAMPTGGPCPES